MQKPKSLPLHGTKIPNLHVSLSPKTQMCNNKIAQCIIIHMIFHLYLIVQWCVITALISCSGKSERDNVVVTHQDASVCKMLMRNCSDSSEGLLWRASCSPIRHCSRSPLSDAPTSENIHYHISVLLLGSNNLSLSPLFFSKSAQSLFLSQVRQLGLAMRVLGVSGIT